MLASAMRRSAIVLAGLSLAGLITSSKAADPGAGKAVFISQCSICHSPQPGRNLVGPSLFGIVGRKTASVSGFHYSPANRSAGLTWDEATLDKYLRSPRTMIPGTFMTYAGVKNDAKRADLVAYLATLK